MAIRQRGEAVVPASRQVSLGGGAAIYFVRCLFALLFVLAER